MTSYADDDLTANGRSRIRRGLRANKISHFKKPFLDAHTPEELRAMGITPRRDSLKASAMRNYAKEDFMDAGIKVNSKGRPYSITEKSVGRLHALEEIRASIDQGKFPRDLIRRLMAKGVELPVQRGYYVYVLQDSQEAIVYVGRATNVLRRVGQHLDDGKDFKYVKYFTCKNEENMIWLEREMIKAFRPVMNKILFKGDEATP